MIVVLPFPPSSLAGHNTGHWRNRDREVATYRAEAFHLTRKALRDYGYKAPENGDIAVSIAFIPPNDRGDRVNYPIRIKAQLDGIAEAIGVNDKRFLPEYLFLPPRKPGRVEVCISPAFIPSHRQETADFGGEQSGICGNEIGPETLRQQRPALTKCEKELRHG